MKIIKDEYTELTKFHTSYAKCRECESTLEIDPDDVHFVGLYTSLDGGKRSVIGGRFAWVCPLCKTGNSIVQRDESVL